MSAGEWLVTVVTAVGTIALVVVTIFHVRHAGSMVREMRGLGKQLGEQVLHAGKMVDEMRQQGEQLADQVKILHEAALAAVAPVIVGWAGEKDPHYPDGPILSVQFENEGKGIARNIEVRLGFGMVGGEEKHFENTMAHQTPVLAPSRLLGVPRDFFERLRDGHRNQCHSDTRYYAELLYEDILGNKYRSVVDVGNENKLINGDPGQTRLWERPR